MMIYRSNAALIASIVLLMVAHSQSLPIAIEIPQEKEDVSGGGIDQRMPECPCFDKGDLAQLRMDIINNKAALLPSSCDSNNKDNVISLRIQYHHAVEEGELEEEKKEYNNSKNSTKEVDHDKNLPPIGVNVPPIGVNIPPNVDRNEFDHGWTVDFDPVSKLGHCKKSPNILFGPYPLQEIKTCQMFLKDACNLVEIAMCPCYDLDDVSTLKNKIETDPSFIVDMTKSCKSNPRDNNGLPFGIYEKNVDIEVARKPANGIKHVYNTMHNTVNAKKYPSLVFRDELKLGVDVKDDSKSMQCYDGSGKVFEGLGFLQSTHCRGLVRQLCSTLRSPSKDCRDCGDDENYRKGGKAWKTCSYITRTPKRLRRNCRRVDKQSGKNIFEHCRKSCFAGSCVDRSDFYFNGQLDKNCAWVAKNEQYCLDDDVARACAVTCGTKCCKDNSNFVFEHKEDEFITCEDIRPLDTEGLCKFNSVANNCKMSCLKCMIQPRI